ncbi:MAG: hypothetical protein J5J06_03045 [Phycisphaerae bacterium]|nr:hypothetical protein [Phycisphaerae bacterium]
MMTQRATFGARRLQGVAALVGVLSLAFVTGCPVIPGGGGGGATGTLSGTVTNDLTDSAVEGVAVAVDPAVDGVDITTAANGTFSAVLPNGIYEITFTDSRFQSVSRTVLILPGLVTTADAALTPTANVIVTTSIDGDPAPGETVTARATVEILDGSTLQSYTWTQGEGVAVVIDGGNSGTPSVELPALATYKDRLYTALTEPPIGADQLPPNVPLPEGEFVGGLPSRFQVAGINPFSLEEAGLSNLSVAVRTSSGTYNASLQVHAELPWGWTTGLRNVPIGVPVLLQGKEQETYDWSLARPSGSGAALTDATTRNPYFTPDRSGVYTLTVTDETVDPAAEVEIEIYAGEWVGAVTGEGADGLPVADNCTVCHNDTIAPDMFTPWRETGHAMIFTDQLNTGDHWGPNCFACHSVGFDPTADNNGLDDQDDYQAFLDSGLINNPSPDNWTTALADFPNAMQFGNIQCENCHGPNSGGAHTMGAPRVSLASDVCGSCHGEPLRHGRFQQWQLSRHANYELAAEEGTNGSCARCHSANGFLAWLPVLLDNDPATDPLADVEVTWTADETHPQTCVTCHDPHMVGTVSGDNNNANVYIEGDSPPLIAGFTVLGAGKGAICVTCHNTRRGLKNDSNFTADFGTAEATRAPHGSAQADILMGQNAYQVTVGVRGPHSFVEDTCVNCHMRQTPPPDLLSYNLGGTNHTFFASTGICAECHGEMIDPDALQDAYATRSEMLKGLIEAAFSDLFAAQIAAGNRISISSGGTTTVIDSIADIASLSFGEGSGRQALTFTLADDTVIGPVGLNSVKVIDDADTDLGDIYMFADERLVKAGWNYNLANNDGSMGVHNPDFVFGFLTASIDGLTALASGG